MNGEYGLPEGMKVTSSGIESRLGYPSGFSHGHAVVMTKERLDSAKYQRYPEVEFSMGMSADEAEILATALMQAARSWRRTAEAAGQEWDRRMARGG